MKLYNKAGVNPMAGCIPALIQMPFDGFVSVFPSAFELRHKSFLWADDLSSFDEIVKLPFTFLLWKSYQFVSYSCSDSHFLYMKMTSGDQQMAAPQQEECQIWLK
jgi:YidC/Oxa1 family membrane protein insertase